MKYGIYTLFIYVGIVFNPTVVFGAVPDVYTNNNYLTSTHEQPLDFISDGKGGFYGHTTSGRVFTQMPVINALHIKLHRFAIDEAFFYISDKGQIWADTDLAAVSIYLTMG